MSVVLVCLPGAPKVSEEAVRKDTELNKYLESRVEGENGWSEPMKSDRDDVSFPFLSVPAESPVAAFQVSSGEEGGPVTGGCSTLLRPGPKPLL